MSHIKIVENFPFLVEKVFHIFNNVVLFTSFYCNIYNIYRYYLTKYLELCCYFCYTSLSDFPLSERKRESCIYII